MVGSILNEDALPPPPSYLGMLLIYGEDNYFLSTAGKKDTVQCMLQRRIVGHTSTSSASSASFANS